MLSLTKQRFEMQKHGDITIVIPRTERIIECDWIERAGAELFHLVDDQGRIKLLIDFSPVKFMSSDFLGKLKTLNQKTRARGGKLVLCRIHPGIYEVFIISRLYRVFCIKESAKEGLEAFNE